MNEDSVTDVLMIQNSKNKNNDENKNKNKIKGHWKYQALRVH